MEASNVTDMAAEASVSAARRLFREAQDEKRRANAHRRRARLLMDRFNRFKRDLEAMGIEVVIEPISPTPQGGASDRSNRSSRSS